MELRSRILPILAGLVFVASAGTAAAARPTLTFIAPTPGGNEGSSSSISHAVVLGASNANDTDNNNSLIEFSVVSVGVGTLTEGGNPVVPGNTLAPGESWTWTPPADDYGTIAAVVVRAFSGGEFSTGGGVPVPITVQPVNDVPSFTKGGDVEVDEDSGSYSKNSWATNISTGPSNESGQTPRFILTPADPGNFTAGPAVDASGRLTFTLAGQVNGPTTVAIKVNDDGGTDRGGVEESASQSFTIDIDPVNDAPSFNLRPLVGGSDGDVEVDESSGVYSVTGWATDIIAGPSDEQTSQNVSFEITSNDQPGLFSAEPEVSDNGTLSFTLNQYENGTATIKVKLIDDGGTPNGGSDESAEQTFTIDVAEVRDPPVLGGAFLGTSVAPLSDAQIGGGVEAAASFGIFDQLTVSDPDHNKPTAESLTVTVTVSDDAELYGTFALGGFTSADVGADTVYTLTGASPSSAQTKLREATFQPFTNALEVGVYPFDVTVAVTDGTTPTALAATPLADMIHVESVNDPPEVNASLAFSEIGDSGEYSPFRVSVSDPDPGDTFSATITETTATALGTLVIASDPIVGDAAAVAAGIQAVRFQPGPIEATSTATFDVEVTDVHPDTTLGSMNSDSVSLTIMFSNDSPEFAGVTTELLRTTDDPAAVPVYPFSTITISDGDSAQSLTVTLALDDPAKGSFSGDFNAQGEITGSAAEVSEKLRAVIFTPTANRIQINTSETVTITIEVDDGIETRSNDQTQIEVTAVDGAPAVLWDVNGINAAGNPNSAGVFPIDSSPAMIAPSPVAKPFEKLDIVDAGDLVVTLTLDTPAKGRLQALGGFVETPVNSRSYRFTGLAADAQTAIQDIEFIPSSSYVFPPGQPGRTNFTITASDSALNLTTRVLPIVLINEARSFLVTSAVDDPAVPGTLRHAVSVAANNDMITFALPSYPAVIRLSSTHGPLVIDKHLSFRGPGADKLAISGDSNANETTDPTDVQLFRVYASARMQGLHLTRGFAVSGGAIFVGRSQPDVAAGILSLEDCIVSDCLASEYGGAVDVVEGSVEVRRCLFENNSLNASSGFGGGAVSLYTSSPCSFQNTTFSGNSQAAPTGFGGGAVYVENFAPGIFFQTHVTHCTFTENSDAADKGSSIHSNVSNTRVILSNSIFSDDSARNLQVAGGSEIVSEGGNVSNDNTTSSYLVGGVPQLVTLLNPPADQLNVETRLAPLAWVEGQTRGHRLLPDSPALGRAVTGLAMVDQRGVIRNDSADSGALDGDALGKLVVHEIFASQSSGDPHFIEFFNPRNQMALDLDGFEVWIDGLKRHQFTGPQVINPGFGIILADSTTLNPAPSGKTPVRIASVDLETPTGPTSDLRLKPRGRIELRAPTPDGAKVVQSVSYVSLFANSTVPTASLDFDDNSITLAPQFVGAALVPHSLVQAPPDGGVVLGATGSKTSPGADTTPTPFGEDNAFPVAVTDLLEITEDDALLLDLLANDQDADGSDELMIVDLNPAPSSVPPATGNGSILSAGGAAVEITPAGSPLRGTAVDYDPRTAFNALPEGARVTDSFAYSIIDVGGGAVGSYTDGGAGSTVISAPSHRLEVNDTVKIRDAATAAYNDDHVISAVSDDTFTIPVSFAADPGPLGRGRWQAALDRSSTGTVPNPSSARSEAVVEVSILGRNDPPTPLADKVSTDEETVLRIFADPDLKTTGMSFDTDALYPASLDYADIGLLANDSDPDTDDNPFTQLRVVGVCQARSIDGYSPGPGGGSVIVAAPGHGLEDGATVLVSGYGGHPSYNAYHVVGVTDPASFTLPVTFIDDHAKKGLWAVLDDDNRLATTSLHEAAVVLEIRADRTHTNVVYNPRTSTHLNGLADGQPETDSFYYAVEDTHGAVSLAEVTVTVTGVNDAPLPGNDPSGLAVFDPLLTGGLTLEQLLAGMDVLYVLPSADRPGRVSAALRPAGGDAGDVGVVADLNLTDEDTFIDLASVDLLGNDGELDRLDDLSLVIGAGQAASRGGAAISINPGGTLVRYDPSNADDLQALAHNERLVDTFEITVTDGIDSVVSLVAVVVEGRNDQPVASAVGFSTPENQLLELGPPGLLLSGAEIDQNMSLPDNQKFLLPVEDVVTDVFGARVDVSLVFRSGPVDALLEVAGTPGATALVSPAHGLQSGEEITLLGSGALNGLYPMARIDDDTFSIPVAFDAGFSSLIGGSWQTLASTFRYDPRGSVFSDDPGGPTFTLQGLAAGQSYPDTFVYTLLDGSFLFANDDIYRVEADRGSIELRVLGNDTSLDGVASSRRIVAVGSPNAGGSVTIEEQESLSLIYSPETGFVGDEVFVYTIEDDLGNRASAKVTARVTIDRLNGNLRANGDQFTVAAGQAPLLDVLANDNMIPATGAPLQLGPISTPPDQGGQADVEGGQVRYTPDAAATVFPYTETFEYTMSGGGTTTATATVTVLVVDRSDTLNVRADAFSVPAGSSLVTLNVLENDNILPGTGEALEIESKTDPMRGTLTRVNGAALAYTPPAGFLGTDSFEYTAVDGFGGSGTALVTVEVGYLTTNTDIFSVLFDDPGEMGDDGPTELDVLANDKVLNGGGGQVTITAVTPETPTLGQMDVTLDGGSLSFDPAEGETGQQNFIYTITDAGGRTATGSVTVVVIDDGIRASSDFFTVQTDSTANLLPVVSNDIRISDLSGDLSVSAIGTGPNGPDHGGSVEISADFQHLIYTPATGFEGVESFTYTVTDGDSSDTALVSVRSTIGEMVAGDDSFLVFRGSEENRLAVLSNDRVIPDAGQLLVISAIGLDSGNPMNPPTRGTIEIIEEGVALQYTPHPDNLSFPYEETFSYEITAGGTARSAAIVRIEVLDRVGARDLETNHDLFTVRSDSGGTLLPVLANDSVLPASASGWDISEVTTPTSNVCSPFLTADFLDPAVLVATLAAQDDPVSEFLWARFQPGSQTTLADNGSSELELRTTLVDEFNAVVGSGSSIHDPTRFAGVVLRPQTQSLLDENPIGEQLIVLNRLLLEDAFPLEVRSAGGGVTQISGNDILYAPQPGFVGTERFTYRVSDGLGGTGFAEVTVRVGDVSVSDDVFSVLAGGGPVALDVTANDGILRVSFPTDPDPAQADFTLDVSRVIGVDPVTAGSAVVDGEIVSFTPDAAFSGPAVLSYWVIDDSGCEFPGTVRVDIRAPGGDRDSEVVTITVNGVNDPPQLVGADPSATNDETSVSPFANATLIEYDEQRGQLVRVRLNFPAGQGTLAGGFTEISPGVFEFYGTAADATAALRGLVFTPFINRIPIGTTEDTRFTVTMDDGSGDPPVVVDSALTTVTPVNDPPVITGTVAAQNLYQYSTLRPFAGVDITEIDDLTLQPQVFSIRIDDPAKGVLLNLGGFAEQPAGSGIYVFNGTAAAAASAMRDLVFEPAGGRATPSQPDVAGLTITITDGYNPSVVDAVTTVVVLHAEVDHLLALDGTGQDASQESASFGTSVAISGDTLVVGSPLRDGAAEDTGAVYVHERNAGFGAPWGQVTAIVGSDTVEGDAFGSALAIDGDLLAVGAPQRDAGNTTDRGAVYLFHRNPADPNDWIESVKLVPSVTNFFGNDNFGAAVAIQGNTLLVGAPRSNVTGSPRAGRVFVYKLGAGGPSDWTLSQALVASNALPSGLPEDEGLYGLSVALDGDTAVVGAPGANRGVNSGDWNLGAVYIYSRAGATMPWAESKRIDQFTDPTVSSFAGFGHAVDISGDRIVVSAHWEGRPWSQNHPDCVHIYERNHPAAGQWGLVSDILPADGAVSEYFGTSVAVSGDHVMIGSPGPTDGSGATRGFTEVYRRSPGASPDWTAIDRLAPGTPAATDRYGRAVAIDGFTGVAGGSADDVNTIAAENAGSARVYQFHYDLGPRTALPVPDQVAELGTPFGFTVHPDTFGDPVYPDELVLGVQLAGGSPLPAAGWLSFDPLTETFSGTPVASNSDDYDLVLFATNPLGTRVLSNQFSITVDLDLAGVLDRAYAEWAASRFGPAVVADPLLEATVWGRTANPDGDANDNMMEMLFGTDPGAIDGSQLGFLRLGANQVSLSFPLSVDFPAGAVHVEWSTDAGTWSRLGVDLTLLDDGMGGLEATAVVTTAGPEPRLFVRVFAGP